MSESVPVKDRRWENISLPRFLGLGLSANIVFDVFVYPAEVLKTRLQVDRTGLANAGTIRYAHHIYKSEGLRAFYRGFWWQALGGFPSLAIYYLSYNFMKDRITTSLELKSEKTKSMAYMASGIAADVFAIMTWVPIDIVIQRLQIQKPGMSLYKGGFDALKTIVRTEGIRGLYRGTGAAMLTYAPASGMWWVAYENSKKMLAPYFIPRELSSAHANEKGSADAIELHQKRMQAMEQNGWLHMTCGMMAGFVGSIVSNPFDVCKTRLQTQHAAALMGAETKPVVLYKNTLNALKHIIRTEGASSLMRGFWPRALFATPASAASSLMYEKLLNMSIVDSR